MKDPCAVNFRDEIFRYGETQSSVGILTTPTNKIAPRTDLPIAVIFNSGLLHRAEPYRLNVTLARRLACLGISTVRVDLAGKGDSPIREGVSNRDSVATDWGDIRLALKKSLGSQKFVLMGICSGADNAIKLSVHDEEVIGLVLMDPVCPIDASFTRRKLISSFSNCRLFRRLPEIATRTVTQLLKREKRDPEANLNLRDLPKPDELISCMQQMVMRHGDVFSVFTSNANSYYNMQGQMSSALAIEGLEAICSEVWWPHMTHLYPVQEHRDLLVSRIAEWFEDRIVPAQPSRTIDQRTSA